MAATVRHIPIHDFEDLQYLVPGSQSEVVQLDPGKMTGAITHLSQDRWTISTGSFSNGIRSCGTLSDHRFALTSLLSLDGPAKVMQLPITPGDVITVAPGQERYSSFQGGASYLSTLIEPDDLADFLKPFPGAQDELLRRMISVLPVARKQAQTNISALQPMLAALIEHAPTMPDVITDFHRRNIMQMLTAPVRNSVRYLGALQRSSNALVREVDRYIMDIGIRPLHVSELCEQFNVHDRRLFRAFHDVHNMGPIAFLRRKRLCDVHAALRQKDGRDATITVKNIATAHGFLDLSHFADSYKRMFGEKPSQTLRRNAHTVTTMIFIFYAGSLAYGTNDCDADDYFLPPRIVNVQRAGR